MEQRGQHHECIQTVCCMRLVQEGRQAKNGRSPTWTYLVHDALTTDTGVGLAISFGMPISPSSRSVIDIGACAEDHAVQIARKFIDAVHATGSRCMIVFDLKEFPTIVVYVDTRDQVEMRSCLLGDKKMISITRSCRGGRYTTSQRSFLRSS